MRRRQPLVRGDAGRSSPHSSSCGISHHCGILSPLSLTGVSWFFIVRAVFLGEKRLPFTRVLEDPSAHSSRCGTCQPPPLLPSLFPPCGTTLPCRPSGQRSFTQAGPIASRVEMKTPSNLSVCRAKLPQSAQVSPQDSGLQLHGRYRCVCARARLRSVVLLSRLVFQG